MENDSHAATAFNSRNDYTVGWICALPIELAAAKLMLDEEFPSLSNADKDSNSYVLGRIALHGVVITCLPQGTVGTNAAATVAANMTRSFTQLRFILMVGIGAGVPNPEETDPNKDIRLGDVVVSRPSGTSGGVIQYDFGKTIQSRLFQQVGTLNKPPSALRSAVAKLEANHLIEEGDMADIFETIFQARPRLQSKFGYPGKSEDLLFAPSYEHMLPIEEHCKSCDRQHLVTRKDRDSTVPVVHYGVIGSANQVMRDAHIREKTRREFGIMCFEMEAAGLMDNCPCLVIRGICDYADSHKNKQWQPYAAMTAAAYGKELLQSIEPSSVHGDTAIQLVSGILDQHAEDSRQHFQLQETHYQDDAHRTCHRTFKTSDYEAQKNVNEDPVAGTCRWVLSNSRYRDWLSKTAPGLLWITADPGCGKSVFARFVIDSLLTSGDRSTRTTSDATSSVCYFFFKDIGTQSRLSTALCAILHQLFDQQPQLLSYAKPAFNKSGEKLQNDTDELWRILQCAARDPRAQPIVCVLDALDECYDSDRRQLIRFLRCVNNNTVLNTDGSALSRIKWLVTSRPYDDLQDGFNEIVSSFPSIRLRGEDENDQIRAEIDLVIRIRMEELASELRLSASKAEQVTTQLLNMEHRTYLWLHLALDDIKFTFKSSLRPEEASFAFLPESVEAAYEKLLSRVATKAEKVNARIVLKIIIGASRPLTISEMALALDVATLDGLHCLADLTVDATSLEERIRRWCGLFVFTNHDHLYLIHQTAKEFLLSPNNEFQTDNHIWKHSFRSLDVECVMARICILFLCLEDFAAGTQYSTDGYAKSKDALCFDGDQFSMEVNCSEEEEDEEDKAFRHSATGTFFLFAAQHWSRHASLAETILDDVTQSGMKQLYKDHYRNSIAVFRSFQRLSGRAIDISSLNNVQLAAANEHTILLQSFLRDSPGDIDSRNRFGRTPLMQAAITGAYKAIEVLINSGADVNLWDDWNRTALHYASVKDHRQVVRLLLNRGADVNGGPGQCHKTPLTEAVAHGHKRTVQILLDRGANPNIGEGKSGYPLQIASRNGALSIVQMLLDKGARVETENAYNETALSSAILRGHEEIKRLVLSHEAASSALETGNQVDESFSSDNPEKKKATQTYHGPHSSTRRHRRWFLGLCLRR